jgi:outer membrane protein OmpA-like peptidoglycan-associated protein
MRYLALLFCLSSCAVNSPSRDEFFSDEPSTTPALSIPQPSTPDVAIASNEAKCSAGVVYDLCATDRYRVEGLFFETNSATLLFPASAGSVKELLRSLLAQPNTRAALEVHTDAQGADSYNLIMSQKRAEALVEYLVKLGVSANQLEAKGLGESKPITPGKTPAERQLNRRVELVRLPTP